ncbi:MAG: DMT family transporter [Oscillospiraceae bacterium]
MNKDKIENKKAIAYAILAAALYALSSPISKLLLHYIPPTTLAALMYLGAGLGLMLNELIHRAMGMMSKEQPLACRDLPYVAGMVVLDIAAPIFLMSGLTMTTAANAALLNNFEIVATSVIALFLFGEKISLRLWFAIALVTLSSITLSLDGEGCFSFSRGSIFILLACLCWGLENNCTRILSGKNPRHIVIIKGFFSGTGVLAISLVIGERIAYGVYIPVAMALGFVTYGLSIMFYIYAQRKLGAAKTSTYYAVSPFIGVGLSLLIFHEMPSLTFICALVIMVAGTYFAMTVRKPKCVPGAEKSTYMPY